MFEPRLPFKMPIGNLEHSSLVSWKQKFSGNHFMFRFIALLRFPVVVPKYTAMS